MTCRSTRGKETLTNYEFVTYLMMLFSFGARMMKHSSTPCSTTMEKEADAPVGRRSKTSAAKVPSIGVCFADDDGRRL